jgi:hypothetical protein
MTNEDRAWDWFCNGLDMHGDALEPHVVTVVALLDAAEARGRAEERACVVADLRHRKDGMSDTYYRIACEAAGYFERGEHAREGGR